MIKPTAKSIAMSDIAAHFGKSLPTSYHSGWGFLYQDWYSFGITHMSLDFSVDMSRVYSTKFG